MADFTEQEYHAKLKETFYSLNKTSSHPTTVYSCHCNDTFYNGTNGRMETLICDSNSFFAICIDIKEGCADNDGNFDKSKFENKIKDGWVISPNIRLVSKSPDAQTVKIGHGSVYKSNGTLQYKNAGNDGMVVYDDYNIPVSQWSNKYYVSSMDSFYAYGNLPCHSLYTFTNIYNIVPYGVMEKELLSALDRLNIKYNGLNHPRFQTSPNNDFVWSNHTVIPVLLYISDDDFDSQVDTVFDGNWTPDNPNKVNAHWTVHVNGSYNPNVIVQLDIDSDVKLHDCAGYLQIIPPGSFRFDTNPVTGGLFPTYSTYTHDNGQINADDIKAVYDTKFRFDANVGRTSFKLPSTAILNDLYGDTDDEGCRYVICCNVVYRDDSYITNGVTLNTAWTNAGYYLIGKYVKKLPANFIDNPILPLNDIRRNIYTYPMGFASPYTFDLKDACNDGFTGNPDYCHALGDTIAIKYDSDGVDDNPDLAEDDDKPKDDIIEDDATTNTLATASGTLTTTYKIDEFTTRQIGGFLWRKDIASMFERYLNNPIENLLAIKMIPIDAPCGNQETIVIGNVDLESIGGREVTSTNVLVNIGTVDMSALNKYGNFIDLPPYTKYVIYLPYIGFREFDGSCCLNKSLNVRYSVDLITGTCLAMLYVSGKFKVAEYEGNIGIDIPISASNRGDTESAILSGLVDTALTLNPINLPSKIVSSVLTPYSYQSKGAPSPTCLAAVNRTCYVLIDRPQYNPIKSFAHTYGLYCNKTKFIGDCKGFTICDANVDLSDINLTIGEINELRQILSTGFYA